MYILDTDHATLYQQGNAALGQRLVRLPPNQVLTTIITYDEQIMGRLAVVHKAGTGSERSRLYMVAAHARLFLPDACTPF